MVTFTKECVRMPVCVICEHVYRMTMRCWWSLRVAAQLVSLRWAMPAVDVRKIVEGQPGLLLRDVGEAAAAVAALRAEFPAVDVSLVIETEPSLLTADCDVPG